MARTYRKHPQWDYVDPAYAELGHEEYKAYIDTYHPKHRPKLEYFGGRFKTVFYTRKNGRDGVNFYSSPPKWFKRLKRRKERFAVKKVLRKAFYDEEHYEKLPTYKASDRYEWW